MFWRKNVDGLGRGWKCRDCDYEHSRKDLVFSHVQSKHFNFPGYICQICGKTSKTLVAHNKHNMRYHKYHDSTEFHL